MGIVIAERTIKWSGYGAVVILGMLLYLHSAVWLVLCFGLATLVLMPISIWFSYQMLRSNSASVVPELAIETWVAVGDGTHNSNTDMIFWNGSFFLAHATSPFHLASRDCRIVIRRSPDTKEWTEVARLSGESKDIRDPKFAPIGGKLFLYVMLNKTTNPEPYTSVFAVSEDGTDWSPFKPTGHPGWLFWRPKSSDGVTWYVPAYWHEHGVSRLLQSDDGVTWDLVSDIHSGGRNDETAIEFLPDGRAIATARLEYGDSICGNPQGSTLVAVADPPYTAWQAAPEDHTTRLDGPALFCLGDRIFAVGRFQPETNRICSKIGSIFTRKRTSIFIVHDAGLIYVSDLPSSGDTSYGAVVERNGYLYICYYTSRIDRDPVWIEGMLGPTDIRIVKIQRDSLISVADTVLQTATRNR